MNTETPSGMSTYGDPFTQWARNGFEIMSIGANMGQKITNSWREVSNGTWNGRGKNLAAPWKERSSSVPNDPDRKDILPWQVSGLPDAERWLGLIEWWKNTVKPIDAAEDSIVEAIRELENFIVAEQAIATHVSKAWLEYLEHLQEAARSGDAKKIWASCSESMTALLETCREGTSEHGKAVIRYWKTLLPQQQISI